MKTRLLLAILLLLTLLRSARAVTVTNLRCEYQFQPLAIDTQNPRLSWVLHSARRGEASPSHHILVASSLERLKKGEGDLWDTTTPINRFPVTYAGKPLRSSQVCYWKVQAVGTKGAAGPWSKPASWEMGLLSQADWRANWINDGKFNPASDADFYAHDPAPLFRKIFRVTGHVSRARLAITGLGYYTARINGKRVGDQELGPAWTRYSKRVYYTVFDVTRQVRSGVNCMGVTLGNGWWNPLPLRMFGTYDLRETMPVGRPRFIAHLDIERDDGSHETVVSDTSWRVSDGPVRFNNIYLGEVYDARTEVSGWDKPGFDDKTWRSPGIASEPIGTLQCQSQPPIRITKAISAMAITEPKPGVYIFDMGQNFGGLARLKVNAAAGTRIVMRYGELLNKDGSLNPMTSVAGQIKGSHRLPDGAAQSVGGPGAPPIAWQSDTYITAGRGVETYTPEFTFHGFRYVEVTGLPHPPTRDLVTGLRLNSDVERVGHFSCSNPLLNRIQQMCDSTFLSNLFSVQSDCPHRERFGYGGDMAATSEAFIMNYDMDRFYAKAVQDFQDSALSDGMFTDTAPFVGIQYCGFAWAMAPALMQSQLERYYGDMGNGDDEYNAFDRWLSLVTAQNPDGIIKSGLSDHESIVPASAPVLLTPFYFQMAQTLAMLAYDRAQLEPTGSPKRLALESKFMRYLELRNKINLAYIRKYVDPHTGKVGDGTQASQAIALETHIIPDMFQPPQGVQLLAINRLFDQVEGPDKSHLTTGIFGTKYLLDELSREGRGDLAYKIVTQTTYPGWGNMLENGATTLWEHWQGSDNTYSQNHPMFGSVSQWLFQWIGGIEPQSVMLGTSSYVVLHPLFLPGLTHVNCSYRSVRGKIVCNWRREKDGIHLDVEVPVGVRAGIVMPTKNVEQITEGGKRVKEANGIESAGGIDSHWNSVYCVIENGGYHFVIRGK